MYVCRLFRFNFHTLQDLSIENLDFWRVDVVRNRELQFDVAKTLVGYYDVYVTCVK